jgi:hypothetical protein
MSFRNSPLAAALAIIAIASCSAPAQQASVGSVIPYPAKAAEGQRVSGVSPEATSALQVAGVIVSTSSGGFTVRQVPSSCSGGYLDVSTTSSTHYSGYKVAPGYQAAVAGTGGCTSSVVASKVVTSSAPSISLTGPVVGKITGGFTISSANCGYEHVYVTASTKGAIPAVGQTASVTGNGACTTYVTAVSIVTQAAYVPHHVLTADYLGAPWGTSSVSFSSAAAHLTWAETGVTNANAIAAAGIKTMVYVSPNRTNTGGPMYTSDESTFAHTCSGSRVYDHWDGTVEWVMNPASSALRSLFASYVNMEKSLGHFDAAFEDIAGALSPYEVYDPFYPSLPCSYTDAAWLSAEIAMNQAVSLPVVVNGLSDLNGHLPSINIASLNGSNVIGGNFEGCYSSTNQKKASTWFWTAVENSELRVGALNKLFECTLRDTSAASSSLDSRIYSYASFLLTYNPSTSVYRTEYATPSGLHVMPETQLVPLAPKSTTPTDVTALKTPGGTYAREFGACYINGSNAGPCAVVVNPDILAHPFPFTTYHHTFVLSGNGVMDAGRIYVSGGAPPSSLPPMEAAIAFL